MASKMHLNHKPYFMKYLLLICLFSFPALSQAAGSLPAYSVKYDPARDAFADGRAAIKLATQTQRRVLIEVGGEWCTWCHILDKFLNDNPDIKKQLHETFVLLKINVSEENDNKEFLSAFPKPLGYPHMYVSEKNGNVLWSKDTADFINNGKYDRKNFIAFFKRWKIKPQTKVSQQ